jgi:hypothetical protein
MSRQFVSPVVVLSNHGRSLEVCVRARLLCLFLFVCASCLHARSVSAQATPPGPITQPDQQPDSRTGLEFDDGSVTAFAGFFENDLLKHLGSVNQDRNYTYGFGFQLSGSFIRRIRLTAPLSALDRLTGMGRAHQASPRRFYTLTALFTGYTPDTLNTTEPITTERPYASIVGGSIRRLTVDDVTWDRAWSSELAVAALGLNVVADLQTINHRWNRRRSGKETPYDPLGWHNQISHGGEPTALYRAGYEQRLLGDESGPNVRKHWQVSGGGEASVGYYTNIGALSRARLGWFSSDFWEFSPNASQNGNQNLGSGSRRRPTWELFAFGGLRPKLVGYNALMQGQFRESVHTVTPRRLVAEWEGGVAAFIPFIRTQIVAQFAQGRSPEYKGSDRSHAWGSILVVYSRSFPVVPQ